MRKYKFHYVYRITNTTTDYYYYGSRSTNLSPSEDIGIKYFSSSSNKLFIQDQKENPKDYHYKIVRIFESSREDATELEVQLHKKFDVKNHPKFINKANQTSVGFMFDTTGCDFGEQFAKDISIRQTGKSNSFYGKHHSIETIKQIKEKTTGKNNHFYGKKHSEETIKIIREKSAKSAVGKKYISNIELQKVRIVLPEELDKYLNSGWIIGRKKFI